MEDIARLSKEANLAYYEQVLGKDTIQRILFFFFQVKDIYLHPALFTVQSGLLSTSGVLMRQKLVSLCCFLLLILHVHPYLDQIFILVLLVQILMRLKLVSPCICSNCIVHP